MPTYPNIYDIANLGQITQGGGSFLDYLKSQREDQDFQRNTEARLRSALALQEAENAGGVQRVEAAGRLSAVQGDLNRRNAIDVVKAQAEAHVAAQRAAATAALQAKYPRRAGENDEDYVDRVGKMQAEGPNRLDRLILLRHSAAESKAADMERQIQDEMSAEERRRVPKVEAAARADVDLVSAFSKAGAKTVPADVPKAILALRSTKGGNAKADIIEAEWQAALTRADDPKKIPYSPELGTKLKRLNEDIAALRHNSDFETGLLIKQKLELMNDKDFIGGRHLDFGFSDPSAPGGGGGGTPFTGPPAPGGGGFSADAAGRKAALAAYLGAGAGPGPGAPGVTSGLPVPPASGSIEDTLRAYMSRLSPPPAGGAIPSGGSQSLLPQLLGVLGPAGAMTAPGTFPGSVRGNPFGASIGGGTPTAGFPDRTRENFEFAMRQRGGGAGAPWTNTLPTGFTGNARTPAFPIQPTGPQSDMRDVIRLFGDDAPSLLAKAQELATSRGMSQAEQADTFNRALQGDQQAIAGVNRVFDYLRMERDNPIQDEPRSGPVDSTIRDESGGGPIVTVGDEPGGPLMGGNGLPAPRLVPNRIFPR